MKVISDVVNFVQAKGLNFSEFSSKGIGSLRYCLILRSPKVLLRICELKDTIQEFMTTKVKFDDSKWLVDNAFLMDISSHLSELNLKFHSKDVVCPVKDFHVKFKLL